MKVNFNRKLLSLDGNIMVEFSLKETAAGKKQHELIEDDFLKKEVILKDVVANALYKDEKVSDKARAYKLAQEIYAAKKEIEVSAENITMIKEVVKDLPVMYSGQIITMIEE